MHCLILTHIYDAATSTIAAPDTAHADVMCLQVLQTAQYLVLGNCSSKVQTAAPVLMWLLCVTACFCCSHSTACQASCHPPSWLAGGLLGLADPAAHDARCLALCFLCCQQRCQPVLVLPAAVDNVKPWGATCLQCYLDVRLRVTVSLCSTLTESARRLTACCPQVNQLLTLLGLVHIAFQPLVINYFLFSECAGQQLTVHCPAGCC